MATRSELMKMVVLGQECRRKHLEYGADFKNPAAVGSLGADAWLAGYKNDLGLWMRVFNLADEPVRKASLGRLRAHDSVVFNAHTSRPDTGEFLGYVRGRSSWARVLLNRAGFTEVPLVSLSRPVKKAVGA
jgi:hypothetical protein